MCVCVCARAQGTGAELPSAVIAAAVGGEAGALGRVALLALCALVQCDACGCATLMRRRCACLCDFVCLRA